MKFLMRSSQWSSPSLWGFSAGIFQVRIMFIKPKEFHWFWCFHLMSNFKMSIHPTEFQWFWCFHLMSHFNLLIKRKEFQWCWCVCSMSNFNMSIKPKELQWFWCVSQSANEPFRTQLHFNSPNRSRRLWGPSLESLNPFIQLSLSRELKGIITAAATMNWIYSR